MKVFTLLATFFILHVIEAIDSTSYKDSDTTLDFTTDVYTTIVYDGDTEEYTTVESSDNDLGTYYSTFTPNTTNSNTTNQTFADKHVNMPTNGTSLNVSESKNVESNVTLSSSSLSTEVSTLSNASITEKTLSTVSESSSTIKGSTHPGIYTTSLHTPTPAPLATSPPTKISERNFDSGGSENLAVGIAVPVLLIASLGLGFLCYKKLRKFSRGYITLDDFGTYEGMNNPNFEL